MKRFEIKRIARSGLTNFVRNGFVSVSSVLVATMTLSVLTGLILFQAVLNQTVDSIRTKVDVTIYFTPEAPEDKIVSLQDTLGKLPEVESIAYTSADDALLEFRRRHADDSLALQALDELSTNPLGATLDIKAKDPSQYESITNVLKGDSLLAKDSASIIYKVNYYQNKQIIDRLNTFAKGVETLGVVLTTILALISIIMLFTTIRLTIYFTREEISVMRLVGAEKYYIEGPFIIEGIAYGLVATIITTILYLPISLWAANKLTTFLGMNLFTYYVSHLPEIFLIILVSGALIGAIASSLAVRRYINK